jgi:hypothetical protein
MTIETTLTDMGFALTSTLVRDDFNGRDGGTTWAVCVTRNGQSIQTEYTAGCGNRHYRNGKPIRLNYHDRTIDDVERNKRTKPDNPTLPDVLSCFVSDAQCVADGQTFEDFAADLGYEEDSRKAEKIFQGCRDEYFGLLRLCEHAELEKLGELFQDY